MKKPSKNITMRIRKITEKQARHVRRLAKKRAEKYGIVKLSVKGRKRNHPFTIYLYELKDIVRKYASGKTNREIMKEYKISRPTLFRYYKRAGGLSYDDKIAHLQGLKARKERGEIIL